MAFLSSPPPSASHSQYSRSSAWHPSNVFGDLDDFAPAAGSGSTSTIISLKPPSSSRPTSSSGLFGGMQPRRTNSNGSDSSLKSAHNIYNGQLSPSFDQTFQSSMNISVSDLRQEEDEAPHPHQLHPSQQLSYHQAIAASSPCAMECSPLPAPPVQVHHQSSSHHHILSPTLPHQRCTSSEGVTSGNRSFDHSFFSKLATHQTTTTGASSTSSSSAAARSRTRSADVPLSNKDVNAISVSAAVPSFGDKDKPLPVKKPYGLLRTSSARPSFPSHISSSNSNSTSTSNSSSQDPSNPFQASPRPSVFLERAHSENTLSLGGTFPKRENRKPSNLGLRESNSTSAAAENNTRPSLVSHSSSSSSTSSSLSQGRKISGSARVRSALPKEWQHTGLPSCDFNPPPLLHAHSAPLVRPLDWQNLESKAKANVRGFHADSTSVVPPATLRPSYHSSSSSVLLHAQSDSYVPTRRSLGTEAGSRLAREVYNASSGSPGGSVNAPTTLRPAASSPSGMDVDTSPAHSVQGDLSPSGADADLLRQQQHLMARSPGLGDLFESDGGIECAVSSPDQPNQITNRKRGIQDADSSFSSTLSSSPVPSAASGNIMGGTTASGSIGKAQPPRLLHRATSALSLGAASRKRGSGNFATSAASHGSSTSSSFLATLAAAANDIKSSTLTDGSNTHRHTLTLSGSTLLSRENSVSSRHRKMSRGADGKIHLLKAGRRSYSMCDSEFYASPPLGDGPQATDYFGGGAAAGAISAAAFNAVQHEVDQEDMEEILNEDVLSPPRKAISTLNSYQPSPEASFTCGFGHKEAQGKILPCFPVKEDGLMRITADTLNDLLGGVYDDHIEQYVIIDCRFEYEYQGGHVEGAINLGTQKTVEKFLLEAGDGGDHLYESPRELPIPSKSGETDVRGNTKKTILVFHCEFSAKRAPTLAKYLRSRDRALNHAAYPAVHFPELYILQGGYAECWKNYPERCEPRGYVPMDDPRHLAARANDLGELRRKRVGVRAKSYTFGEGMFAAKPPLQPKHLSGLAFKPTSSSSLASSSFTASSVALGQPQQQQQASSSSSTSNNKGRSSFNANLFNAVNSSKLCIHEEEHDDEEHGNSSSADLEGDHSFTNTRHGQAESGTGGFHDDNNSSPCGPMMGAGATALGEMSLGSGDSPCQSSKPTKFIRPGLMTLQPSTASRGLFKPRGMQRASTTMGTTFLG